MEMYIALISIYCYVYSLFLKYIFWLKKCHDTVCPKSFKVHTKRNFCLISFSKELSKWWRMAFIWLWSQSWLLINSRFWLMQLRWLVTSWQQNMECLCKYWVYRVEILQGWCAAWTAYCDSGCDITIATSSLPDLYLPKIKDALFVAPEFNGLSWGCAV